MSTVINVNNDKRQNWQASTLINAIINATVTFVNGDKRQMIGTFYFTERMFAIVLKNSVTLLSNSAMFQIEKKTKFWTYPKWLLFPILLEQIYSFFLNLFCMA